MNKQSRSFLEFFLFPIAFGGNGGDNDMRDKRYKN